jgi:hypothetical protein
MRSHHMRYPLLVSCAIAALTIGSGLARAQSPVQNQTPAQSTEQGRSAEGSRQQREPASAGRQADEDKSSSGSTLNRRGSGERQTQDQSERRDRYSEERGRSREEGRGDEARRGERDFDRERGGYERRAYEERRYGDRDRDRSYQDRRYGDRRYGERREFEDRRFGARAERGYEGPRHLQISRRQRTRVHEALIRRRVEPTSVDFPLRVGARVPNYISSYELPDEVYDYAPGYEGYRYFITGDEAVIVDPETMEVVAVLD